MTGPGEQDRGAAGDAAPDAVTEQEIVVRGQRYSVERVHGDPPVRHDVVRSHTRASATTFGPTGRAVATALVLLPTLLLFLTDHVFWVFASIASWLYLPWALRDIWRATRG